MRYKKNKELKGIRDQETYELSLVQWTKSWVNNTGTTWLVLPDSAKDVEEFILPVWYAPWKVQNNFGSSQPKRAAENSPIALSPILALEQAQTLINRYLMASSWDAPEDEDGPNKAAPHSGGDLHWSEI